MKDNRSDECNDNTESSTTNDDVTSNNIESRQQKGKIATTKIQNDTTTTSCQQCNNNPSLWMCSTTNNNTSSSHHHPAAAAAAVGTSYDDQLLHRAIADAGRWAYGTVLVEVWALEHKHEQQQHNNDGGGGIVNNNGSGGTGTYLFRPESGWWIDPVYHGRACEQEIEEDKKATNCCQICRLMDSSRSDFVPPQHVAPGEGLPGVLWSEASSMWTRTWRERLSARILAPQHDRAHQEFFVDTRRSNNKVVWRDVQQIDADPLQPWNPRLKLLASLGLGYAAAVPFNLHHHGCQGIVIYMARENVDMDRLRSETNENYLIAASDLIAAAYALRGPRNEVVRDRRRELKETMSRVRSKILDFIRCGGSLKELAQKADTAKNQRQRWEEDNKYKRTLRRVKDLDRQLKNRIGSTLRKSKGSGLPPPPPFNWLQTLWTGAGVFLTLLAVTSLNDRVTQDVGDDYSIVMGPFGAFMTLLYGLTAAPASQPINALVGQALSMTIALSLGLYASDDGMDVWLRQSLAAALSIAAMAKLGILHPPAGASAVVFASGGYGWGNMAFGLIGNAIAIGMATVINNLSDKRQYPIYWGIDFFFSSFSFLKKKPIIIAQCIIHTTKDSATKLSLCRKKKNQSNEFGTFAFGADHQV